MRNLILAPEALADAREAYASYELQRPGLGAAFLRSLDARIALVHRLPEIFAVEYRNYRRVALRRFPFAVLYECSDDLRGVSHVRRPGKMAFSRSMTRPRPPVAALCRRYVVAFDQSCS